jgi:transcription initiation factor TFIID subunit 1
MKKNQERRLHRKNAKIVKEGGTPMQLSRPLKPDTTVSSSGDSERIDTYHPVQRRCGHCGQMGHMSTSLLSSFRIVPGG